MKVVRRLDSLEFQELFTQYEQYAFRLETLQEYAVSYEDKPFQDFLSGKKRYTDPEHMQWIEMIKQNGQQGKKMSRVHIIEEPLTEYVKFEILWPYRDNVDAGDDIGLIPVKKGDWPENLPHDDFWLFDNKLVALMNYDDRFGFVEAVITDEKSTVDNCIKLKDQAIALSIAYEDYLVDKKL